jgi:hypothetical protein
MYNNRTPTKCQLELANYGTYVVKCRKTIVTTQVGTKAQRHRAPKAQRNEKSNKGTEGQRYRGVGAKKTLCLTTLCLCAFVSLCLNSYKLYAKLLDDKKRSDN